MQGRRRWWWRRGQNRIDCVSPVHTESESQKKGEERNERESNFASPDDDDADSLLLYLRPLAFDVRSLVRPLSAVCIRETQR